MISMWDNKANTMEAHIPQRTRFLEKSWTGFLNLKLFLLLNLIFKTLNILGVNELILNSVEPKFSVLKNRLRWRGGGVRKRLKYPSLVLVKRPYLERLHLNNHISLTKLRFWKTWWILKRIQISPILYLMGHLSY